MVQFAQQLALVAGLVTCVSAHGTVVRVVGANGVTMPGKLSPILEILKQHY